MHMNVCRIDVCIFVYVLVRTSESCFPYFDSSAGLVPRVVSILSVLCPAVCRQGWLFSPGGPVEVAVAYGLGNMLELNVGAAFKVGNGAGYF